MARLSTGGSKKPKTKITRKKNITPYQAMEKARVPDKKNSAYGRTGSAANQKRMIDNEANGTAWKTGYKTGLPSKKKKKKVKK